MADYDLIVIGAGPGGYVAAIRAAQLGLKVACVEKQYLGGTCLNVGCIPSKALLESSLKYDDARNKLARHGITFDAVKLDLAQLLKRKDDVVKQLTGGVAMLFKKNKVDHLAGTATIVSPGVVEVAATAGTQRHNAKNIIIATGSTPIELPGLKFDGKYVGSSTDALAYSSVPKRLLVVGGGYIGIEMTSVWSRLGADVLVVEFTDRILPNMDKELVGLLQRSLEKKGVNFLFGAAAKSTQVVGDKVKVIIQQGDKTIVEEVDRVLVCTGRKPNTDSLGLDAVGVARDKRGFVLVNDHYATNVPGIYAIGDVIGGMMLAHKAEEEGVALAENLAGRSGHVNYKVVPAVVYTHPELCQVGLTEDEARAAGHEVRVGKFPLKANGRAISVDDTEGWMKVVGDAKTDRLLGVQILASHGSEILAEACVAMEFHASTEDLARTMHAHPTMSEALKEAALAVDKRAIHF